MTLSLLPYASLVLHTYMLTFSLTPPKSGSRVTNRGSYASMDR